MQKFDLVGVIQRTVVETFDVQLTAHTASEAQDLLYEILSEFPDSELVADRMLCVNREGTRPTSIVVEVRGSETEEVFSDDDDYDNPA